jgi:hypothetical protein
MPIGSRSVMSNGTGSGAPERPCDKRVVELIFNNVAANLAIILTLMFCCLLIFERRYDMEGSALYVLLLVIAFHFTTLHLRR